MHVLGRHGMASLFERHCVFVLVACLTRFCDGTLLCQGMLGRRDHGHGFNDVGTCDTW
jgi:hypothetical protein